MARWGVLVLRVDDDVPDNDGGILWLASVIDRLRGMQCDGDVGFTTASECHLEVPTDFQERDVEQVTVHIGCRNVAYRPDCGEKQIANPAIVSFEQGDGVTLTRQTSMTYQPDWDVDEVRDMP